MCRKIDESCCILDSAFGYSLRKGVQAVGLSTIAASSIALMWSIISVCYMASTETSFNHKPLAAINMLCGLFCSGISVYQIAISLMLLWQTRAKSKGDVFICTLWFVSHISIMTLYSFMFLARTAVFTVQKQYITAVFNMLADISHKVVFIYFCLVVKSFSYNIDEYIFY